MNREIKFKVWDTEFNEFTEYHKNRALVTEINKCDRFVFLQFTGLHDKNGVEIYERDIIKISDVVCEITWNDGSFQMITDKNQGRSPALQDRVKNFEIIGNIYENKDLLT